MSSPRGYDRFMIANELAGDGKLRRLNDAQFRCLVTGIWALASKARPRGYLVVAGEPATADDVASQARCSLAVARKTLAVARARELIEMDDELGVEFVHDWWDVNPDPKPDPTNAERQARWRARRKAARNTERNATSNGVSNAASNAASNGAVTPGKLKGRVNPSLELAS